MPAVFEKWWKLRNGIDDAEIPVLPESMAKEVNEFVRLEPFSLASAAKRRAAGRRGESGVSASDNWAFLRPRLKLMVEMQQKWGNIHKICTTAILSLERLVTLSLTSLTWKVSRLQMQAARPRTTRRSLCPSGSAIPPRHPPSGGT